jgi:Na+/H+ antiporter NhaD/arsenite permease-like protein
MSVFGIPVDFILFALTLLGVALFHHHTLKVAVIGLLTITAYKLLLGNFGGITGVPGLFHLLSHEAVTLANLLGLLLGFALLADHFEKSGVPDVLPDYLPDDWKGGFAMLLLVFVMSAFLDNIAAAMIGGAMAASLYRRKVHIGFLAAIVAASNAGGAGSVVGDTTTTMMWIDGVAPGEVLEAYVGAVVALCIFGIIAARQQHAYQPITKDALPGASLHVARLMVVVIILLSAAGANVYFNLRDPAVLDHFPVIGTAVWLAILATAPWRTPNWKLLPGAFKGAIFLLSLVVCAAMMPVDKLPAASWPGTLALGFLSSVFDNIPLTALALKQGGYDWGFLAYGVGFGGSMIWFGSSAGVALSNLYPEAKSVGAWLKGGWHVALGYVVGFFVLVAVVGWHPSPKHSRAGLLTAPVSEALPAASGADGAAK